MDANMLELVEKIMYGVSFIAIGGTLALVFFCIFAPSIFGSRVIHRQLETLQRQIELVNQQLKQIAEQCQGRREGPKKGP
jgi:hypothetical protein